MWKPSVYGFLWRPGLQQAAIRRSIHRRHACFLTSSALTDLSSSSRPRIFLSRSSDPYLNLSIEHHLLRHSHPDSTVLFLYTNRPCVVLGRNQNPWLEVDLRLLKRSGRSAAGDDDNTALAATTTTIPSDIDLVRRRSGGGTVFHDAGNVNYCVICPTAAFDRDRHAHLVVRALTELGVATAMVNARHDIVLQRGDGSSPPYKVSGSAYKVTRLRSLHHGTCLLSSPNLRLISRILKSPAKAYIKAQGVDSVSSPVANVNIANAQFEDAVVHMFRSSYPHKEAPTHLGDDEIHHDDIRHGVSELQSQQWIYGQTPLFAFSSSATVADPRTRPTLPSWLPRGFVAMLTARHGIITEAKLDYEGCQHARDVVENLPGKQVHQLSTWFDGDSLSSTDMAVQRWLRDTLTSGI